MGQELLEKLQETTRVTREREPERRRTAAELEKQAQRRASRERSRIAGKFVKQELESAVDRLTSKMEGRARNGGGSVEEQWTAHDVWLGSPDEQDLANKKALRDKVARHFTELNFDVRKFEYEAEERNPNIPISDGYSHEHPPMRRIGEVIGLAVSWAHEATE